MCNVCTHWHSQGSLIAASGIGTSRVRRKKLLQQTHPGRWLATTWTTTDKAVLPSGQIDGVNLAPTHRNGARSDVLYKV